MWPLPCPLYRVLSVVLDHFAETGLTSFFDPPSLDPFLSMLLGYATETGLKSRCGPPCPYRSKLISIRVRTGPGNPGKSWNFIITFSRTGKSWKNTAGPGKSWKSVKLNKVIKF